MATPVFSNNIELMQNSKMNINAAQHCCAHWFLIGTAHYTFESNGLLKLSGNFFVWCSADSSRLRHDYCRVSEISLFWFYLHCTYTNRVQNINWIVLPISYNVNRQLLFLYKGRTRWRARNSMPFVMTKYGNNLRHLIWFITGKLYYKCIQ